MSPVSDKLRSQLLCSGGGCASVEWPREEAADSASPYQSHRKHRRRRKKHRNQKKSSCCFHETFRSTSHRCLAGLQTDDQVSLVPLQRTLFIYLHELGAWQGGCARRPISCSHLNRVWRKSADEGGKKCNEINEALICILVYIHLKLSGLRGGCRRIDFFISLSLILFTWCMNMFSLAWKHVVPSSLHRCTLLPLPCPVSGHDIFTCSSCLLCSLL